MKEAYAQGLESEEDEDSIGDQIKPRDVGHNIYILAHQVIKMPELVFVCDGGITAFPLCLSDLLPTSGPCTAAADVCLCTSMLLFHCVLCVKC